MTTSPVWESQILDIAVRPANRQSMVRVTSSIAAVAGSLEGDHGSSRQRGITFLAVGDWCRVCAELETELPWYVRRANVLLDADSLVSLIGCRLHIGDLLLQVHCETEPCGRMDEIHAGLCEVLRPDCRAGVYGEVLQGGCLSVGDTVRCEV